MKQKIKIAFADFWNGFIYDPTNITISNYDNVFYQILSEKYDIEINQSNPDYLIFSAFGNSHYNYNCKKIFYTGENLRPNFSICDYALTFDYMDDNRNYRFPLSAISLYEAGIKNKFEKNIDFDQIKKEKTKFCNFVFSNPAPGSPRVEFYNKLSSYKKVDAGGRVLNNLGYLVGDKLEFLNNYKFTICFENTEFPGYTTEKIVHPKFVDSIPIYWGNREVGKDWNIKAFINAFDFKSLDDLVEYVKLVDNDEDLYKSILMEPHFIDDKVSHDLDYRNLLEFFDKIFS